MPKKIAYGFDVIDTPEEHPTWTYVLIVKYTDGVVEAHYSVLLDGRKATRDCTCLGWYYRQNCKHGDMVRKWLREYRPLEVT